MNSDWKEKVALVTGASSGIGRATALAFAEEGVRVMVADLSADGGEETVRLIRNHGGEATFIKTDVARAQDVEAMVAKTIKTYGRLDCAFNNAGVEGTMGSVVDCTEENWNRTINTDLKGVWLCMKYELAQMLPRKHGAIVNTSSVAGLVGFAGSPAYVAAKHGIVGLTRTAALETAKLGIRVNAVCPGVIQTPMIERVEHGNPDMHAALVAGEPIGRLGRPEEIASTVLWLCSDAASFVTGQAIAVDGGWVAQ